MNPRTIIYTLVCSLGATVLFSQNDSLKTDIPTGSSPFEFIKEDTTSKAAAKGIRMISKRAPESIKLRWAPLDIDCWREGNTHGYILERLEIKDIDMTKQPNFKRIENRIFKPFPMNKWKTLVNDAHPYRAVAAMGIYGNRNNNAQGFLDAAQDYENRYGFHLLAADLDFVAAEASALGYVDKNVDPELMYIYRIYPAISGTCIADDTISILVGTELDSTVTPTLEIAAEAENNVSFQWDPQMKANENYTAFILERSADGVNFNSVNSAPIINFKTNANPNRKTVKYIDSLDQNYQKYHYRLIGLDPFGDQSEPSATVIAMGKDKTPPDEPTNVKTTQNANNQFLIEWEFDEKANSDFKGFIVAKSTNDIDQLEPMHQDFIPRNSRSFVDPNPDLMSTNYYQVIAVDTSGNYARSPVVYGITLDDVPPASPTNLVATIDASGKFLLKWDAPADKDIKGYQVHFSNHENSEFAVIPGDYIQSTYYVDSISVQTLSEEIYFYVLAVDHSYNRSLPSETTRLKKPDLIPPTASNFSSYQVSEEGISIEWVKSQSADLREVILKRKDTNMPEWEQITTFNPNSKKYLDTQVEQGVTYEYQLLSIDDDGNMTPSTKNLIIEALKPFYLESAKNLKAQKTDKGIQLSWDPIKDENYSCLIYKAKLNAPLELYKKLNSSNTFVDNKISKEKSQYAIKFINSSGKESELSKIVKI